MLGKIYKITNNLNNKVYIGQTTQSLTRRFNCHCCNDTSGRGRNMYIKRAILKYGKEHFKISLIEETPIELLDDREIYWISYYNSYEEGYNLTIGGNSNRNVMTTPIENTINISEFKSFIINNYPTVKQVIEHFPISRGTVYNLIHRLNDPNLVLNPYNPRKGKDVININTTELVDKYNEGWSILDLSKLFRIKKNKISLYLKSLGIIPRRGIKGYKHRI